MTWNFTFKANSKAEAKAGIPAGCPEAFKPAIVAAIDFLPDPLPPTPPEPGQKKGFAGNCVQVQSVGNVQGDEQRFTHGSVSVNIVPRDVTAETP